MFVIRRKLLWPCRRHASREQLFAVLLLTLYISTTQVRSECRIGLLEPAAGWTVTSKHMVNSIVPSIIPPEEKSTSSQVAARLSEASIYAEVRPLLPPARQPRLCLRSMSTTAAACASGKPMPAADQPVPADPQSFLFNVTENVPVGPCLTLNDDGTEAKLQQDRPRPESCWPGAGYCSDSSTTWTLTRNVTAGKQLVWLSIVRTVSTYQDTDGQTDMLTTTIPFRLSAGCVLQASVGTAAADQARTYCLGCSRKGALIQSTLQDASSSTCMKCPVRSSKAAEAIARVQGASNWRCVPGMPKGFETIAVRMGAGGHPECASINGRTCLRSIGTAVTCQAVTAALNKGSSPIQARGAQSAAITSEAGSPTLRPLACGAAHAAVWSGDTGYKTPGHWCSVSRDWLHERQPSVQGKCVTKL